MLVKLMDRERESERTKNELITNVAHDLRTPLTSIIGYLELLSGPVKLNEEMQKKYLDITYKKSKRLQKLIEDLFGFTKLNYGKICHEGMLKLISSSCLSQMLEEVYPNFMEKRPGLRAAEQCNCQGDHGGRQSCWPVCLIT